MNDAPIKLSLIHPDVFELNDFVTEPGILKFSDKLSSPVHKRSSPVEMQSSPVDLPDLIDPPITPVELPEEPVNPDMSWVKPIMSIAEIEQRKANAITMRDRYVECINNLSEYRILTHQYIPITRNTIDDIEWIKGVWLTSNTQLTNIQRVEEIIKTLTSLPMSFAFVMAVRNDECRKMSDADILCNFFGEDSQDWLFYPNGIINKTNEMKMDIYENYKYMAHVVVNEIDELMFSIDTVGDPLDGIPLKKNGI